MDSIKNYEKGMSPYEWVADCVYLKEHDIEKYKEAYSPLDDFLEVSFDGDRIKTLYSAFYWDI